MTLSSVAIKRPVFTVMVMTAMLVLGLVGFRRLGSDLFPDVSFPAVVVTVPYPGASPKEVETLVAKPLEDATIGINGIDRVRSFSREGSAMVFVMFNLGVDVTDAATEVRERVSQVRYKLPDETKEPIISRFDVSASPVLTYTVRGAGSLADVRDYTNDVIRPALEQVDGVAAVDIKGGQTREIRVLLDRPKLDALGIPLAQVVGRLRAENLNVPAGHYDEGKREVSVRTVGEFKNVDQIRDVIVATAKDGSVVRLRDVANVVDGFADETTLVRVNGTEAVTFEVRKQSGKNTVEIAHAVKAKLAELAKSFPAGTSTSLLIDQSRFIEVELSSVQHHIVIGACMAVLIILVFMMDLRSTLISAVALPTSVIGTFYVMYVLGFTLNMMTLLALSLAIGLLIDDAVVVRENIFKHIERGKPPMQAALDGTQEVALSVFATTLTIIAVFLPVAFVKGMVGQFFRQFGITISAAVAISLFVAFTLDPMLSSRFSKTKTHERGAFDWLKAPFEWTFRQVEATYAAMLGWSVRHKLAVGAFAVLSMVFMGWVTSLMGSEFVNSEDRSQFVVESELPAGTALAETSRLSAMAENELLKTPEIQVLASTVGVDGEPNKIRWRIATTPKAERSVNIAKLKEAGRRAAQLIPGAKVTATDPPFVEGAATEAPIMINVRGSEFPEIEAAAGTIEKILKATPGVSDIQVRYSPGRPELEVELDRQRAADRGLSVSEVALALRTAMEGDESGNLRSGTDEIPIRVRLSEDYRADEDALKNLTLQTSHGPVKLSDVANFHRSEGPQVIERENRQRQITLWATPIGRPLGDVAKEFQPAIKAAKLGSGISVAYDGQLRLMNETNENMAIALLLGVVFIYIVLASQFESFVHPFTIMLTLPLALVGGVVGLFLTNNTMAMGALIGIVLLMGLVTKNAILLIDRAIVHVRDHGMTPFQAIVTAGPERLRPILMTSAAMVLGMLPTATSNGEGSEFRAPMAIAVIGGVVSSTLLSLIVVPVFYLAIENLKRFLPRMAARVRAFMPGGRGRPSVAPNEAASSAE
ncbi:MAG TPA: efflux RND transporter permease subunit [Polyangiaceae bacterium]|nr:efflux RND transporter permease subunit [Polyangiaceae bacterium]